MFKSGDSVYIKDSAEEDITNTAWQYIKNHRTAAVVSSYGYNRPGVPESEFLYVVVWPEQFIGGWDCYQNCIPGYGVIITDKNMELNFEDSTDAVTVPNIKNLTAEDKILLRDL